MAQFIKGTKDDDFIEQNDRPQLTIQTLAGSDVIDLDLGNNVVDAGSGRDFVTSTSEDGNTIFLGKGDDVYFVQSLTSSGGRDRVDGGDGNDELRFFTNKSSYFGGDGDDFFHSNGRKNDIDGGDGIDAVTFTSQGGPNGLGITLDLSINAVRTGTAPKSIQDVISIEHAVGSIFADTMTGSNVDNFLSGYDGADILRGLGGDDSLEGGLGQDSLSGDSGADQFFFRTIADSQTGVGDVILDFSSAEGDVINLVEIDFSGTVTFIADGAFTGSGNGEIRFAGGFVTIDVNGDAVADMEILTNLASMSNTDLLV